MQRPVLGMDPHRGDQDPMPTLDARTVCIIRETTSSLTLPTTTQPSLLLKILKPIHNLFSELIVEVQKGHNYYAPSSISKAFEKSPSGDSHMKE